MRTVQIPSRCLLFVVSFFLSLVSSLSADPLSEDTVKAKASEIDRLLDLQYDRNGITPQPIISDEVFLRRSYLGIVGRIPTVEETLDFFADSSPQKRNQLIDELYLSAGYSSHLNNYLGDLLRVQTSLDQHGLGWSLWLKDRIDKNQPYDQLVSDMLSANGHCADNPATGYYLRDRNMLLDNVSNTVQTFLGVRMGCAQCHDHPFDDWSQREFYEIASYSAQMNYSSEKGRDLIKGVVEYLHQKNKTTQPDDASSLRKKGGKKKAKKKMGMKNYRQYRNLIPYVGANALTDDPKKTLKLPHDYKYSDAEPGDLVAPRVPFGEKINLLDVPQTSTSGSELTSARREPFAAWLTSSQNPYFAKTIANRLWKRTFGVGLAEPVDDWSSGDAVIPFPEVLANIEQLMIDLDFDTREFQRVLWHTKLFQRGAAPDAPESLPHNFSGPILRRMSAEQLYDSCVTLLRGNPDGDHLNVMQDKWDDHLSNLNQLFSTPPEELLGMAEEFKKIEEAKYGLQRKALALKKQLGEAAKERDMEQVKELKRGQKDLKRAYTSMRNTSQAKLIIDLDQRRFNFKSQDFTKNGKPYRFSEYPAPFRPAQLPRQFGASDRETTDASHTKATIPQVLALYNGNSTALLTNGHKSELFKNLLDTKVASERLNYLFLALYSRLPNDEEKAHFTEQAATYKDLRILTRAALNSKRFFFIE